MRVAELLECCLYAEPLEETARFYAEVLGLEEISRVPGRHVFFRCGRRVFLLFNPARTLEPQGEIPTHGARGPGHVAFAATLAELDPWRARLEERGVAVESDVAWPGGGRSLYFRDPAGNSVEIATPRIWGLAEEPPAAPA